MVAPALADQLLAARRRAFVGRQVELALFEKLVAPEGEGAVVYVHGPGGVGKSTLLRQVGWLAGKAGRQVIWLDGRDLAPDAIPVALGRVPEGPLLVVVDSADRLGPADRWLREELLATLPGDAVLAV